jgi:hypothetical protein
MAMHFPIMSTSSCAQEWNDRAAAAFQLEGTQPAQANRPLQSEEKAPSR